MSELFLVGVDLAKRVFQLHGVDEKGAVLFRKKLTRPQFEKFVAEIESCSVVFEACAPDRTGTPGNASALNDPGSMILGDKRPRRSAGNLLGGHYGLRGNLRSL